MADVFDKFKPYTYRGIKMFYKGSSETSGFKHATHTYPGSDNFTVEQLGKKNRVISVSTRVDFDSRDRVNTVLNTPGSGILSFPLEGNLIVKVLDYTKRDTVSELGFYDYEINYAVEIGLIIPRLSNIGLQVISSIRAAGVTSFGSNLKSGLSGLGF